MNSVCFVNEDLIVSTPFSLSKAAVLNKAPRSPQLVIHVGLGRDMCLLASHYAFIALGNFLSPMKQRVLLRVSEL